MRVSKSSGNVFADIGFDRVEADELAAKADLITLVSQTMRARKLTQKQAASLCGVDQPTLSKVLSGAMDSVTIDRLTRWLVALGGRVQINVTTPKAGARSYKGTMRVNAA
jgi:predicted XRE-type DNA-binding protein